MASPATYCKRFCSFDMAYQRMFDGPRQKAREKMAKLEGAIDVALTGDKPDAFQKLKEALDKARA